MVHRKPVITPLLMKWTYHSLALSHRYGLFQSRVKRFTELSEEEIDRLFSDFGTNRHNRRQSSRHRDRERPVNDRRPANDQPRDQRPQRHRRRHNDGEDDHHRAHQHHHHRDHHRSRSRQETRARGRRTRPTTQGTLPTSFDIYDVTTPMPNSTRSTTTPKPVLLVGSAYERNRMLRPSRSSENFVESGQIARFGLLIYILKLTRICFRIH